MGQAKRKIEETKESPVLFRDLIVDSRKVDKKKRTIELSFSSEEPVRRWGEDEVLDHQPESVRLQRAEKNGPLLMDHNWSDQIGTIEEIRIDADRVGRAVVRFGKSKRASEIFEDVVDNIRKSISVGYRVFKVLREEMSEDEPDVYRVVDWEPLEISFVSVPADITVGVGRSSESGDENSYTLIRSEEILMDKKDKNKTTTDDNRSLEEIKSQAKIDAKRTVDEAREAEVNRQTSIRAIGGTYDGHDSIVRDALNSDTSVDNFVELITDAVLAERENDVPDTHLDLGADDVKRYSVLRAIRAVQSGNWDGAEFERECNVQIEKNLGRDAQGIFVPHDIQQRVITTTGGAAGTIGVDHQSGSFIDILRDSSLVMRLGARRLTGLRGNIDIPRKTGSSTFALVDEDQDAGLTDMSVGSISLSPKTMAGGTAITRKTLLQSSPDMDALVMQDLAEGAALFMDLLALIGGQSVSTNTSIEGILATTGVLTQAISSAGSPTWPETVGFETAVTAANAINGQNFITTAPVRGNMKTIKKDAGSGIFLIEDNKANGYPVFAKTDSAFPANSMLFGDFSQVIYAMWGVLDLVPDLATKAASGGLVVRAFQDLDIAVRQPTAFCKNS